MHQASPLTDSAWDKKVEALPGASFFHGAAWAKVLYDTYGYTPSYFAAGESAAPDGVFPLMEIDSWLTGRRGISLPFTDECGPIGRTPETLQSLWDAATAHGRVRKWKFLENRTLPALVNPPAPSLGFNTHVLDLTLPIAQIEKKYDSAVRRAIKKAEQSNLELVMETSEAAMAAYYELMCITRKRHGLPPQPYDFFANIQRHVLATGQGWIVLARHNGQLVAGAVFLRSFKKIIYKFGASDDSLQHLRGNNLVMAHAIREFNRLGFESLDFGRTSDANEGLRRYKLSWGTTEHRLGYTRVNCQTGASLPMSDDAAGWHNKVFNFMPSPCAKLIGSALYRHIA